jgi:hypothetical protein
MVLDERFSVSANEDNDMLQAGYSKVMVATKNMGESIKLRSVNVLYIHKKSGCKI